MMMEAMHRRMAWLRLWIVLFLCVLAIYLAWISGKSELVATSAKQGQYTCLAGTADGTIYDRNGVPLVNQTMAYRAVVSPTPEAVAALLSHVEDKETFYEKVSAGMPFVCDVDTNVIDCPDVTVLEIPCRNAVPQLAQHLIGYTLDGVGVSGLECAYDAILREESQTSKWRVTFSVDGRGGALAGEPKQIRYGANPVQGVVTTLDAKVQQVCESAGKQLEKGCVVVLDAQNGDILGLASFPTYQADALGEALENPDSPLINRAFYAYPVGSIFKLVTAACAWENGIDSTFQWDCTGEIFIGTQRFRCHDLSGHGRQTMPLAMRNSCNPYFIALSQELDGNQLLRTARQFGFGEELMLCGNMTGSGGTLPTLEQLSLPAERANFCFGQGVLTASPLQIARMTCAIAGDGRVPMVRLVRGLTENGYDVPDEKETVYQTGISSETASYLRSLMCYAAMDSDFQGKPEGVQMGAKTSTAQTGRLDENGEEYCHGWVTAFFPVDTPKYVVTVLAEDAGYGNQTAAPVLYEIAKALSDTET